MDEILENVKSLDIVQLRRKLLEIGISVGPITPTTKSLFQRRLAKALFEASAGHVSGAVDTEDSKTVSKENVKDLPSLDSSSDVFCAVSLPENVDPHVSVEVGQLVFSDKDLALKTAKKVKGSRFKVFKSQREAEEFSKLTAEHTFSSPMKAPKAEESKDEVVNTESIPYKAPKPQDLVQVRKVIEKGDVKLFLDYVWNNPRYLVSNGDTPVIYQEGFRYTGMHIAAIKNQPEICRVILDTLEDSRFIQQLYSQSRHTEDSLNNRINFLVDLYLNMPDKGNCESPLHMACKFGFDEVVRILAAHPKTDKLLKNKYGETPKELICSRSYNALTSTITRIEELLQGQYYVPLIRSIDNSTLPVIGQPWSHDINKSPVGVGSMPSSPMSPRDPVLSIKACAGPMTPSFANDFHKKWTTPPSDGTEKARLYLDSKRGDSEKGMERIGRHLAHEMQVPWIEHWDFLDSYADLSTAEGLDVLEEYFKKTLWHTFIKEFKDRHGIEELFQDFTELSTPIKAKGCDIIDSKGNTEDICYNNISEEKDVVKNLSVLFSSTTDVQASPVAEKTQNLEISAKNNLTAGVPNNGETNLDIVKEIVHTGCDEEESNISKKSSCDSPESNRSDSQTGSDVSSPNSNRSDSQSNSDVVSPMTSLSQHFAQLSVLDDSWSDKVNNNTRGLTGAASNNLNAGQSISNKILKDNNQTAKSDEITVKGEADVTSGEVNVLVSKTMESKVNEVKLESVASDKTNTTEQVDVTENKSNDSDTAGNVMNANIDESKNKEESTNQEPTVQGDTGATSTNTTELTIVAEKNEMRSSDAENKINNNVKDTTVEQSEDQASSADTVKISTNDVSVRTDSELSTKDESTINKDSDDHSVAHDHKLISVARKHLLSERSDSTASYKTAEEDFYDSGVMSPFSDDRAVCIKLMYNQSLDRLKEEIDSRNQRESESDSEPVYLLVRHKTIPVNGSMKFDIVLYPTTDSVNEMLLLENLDVLSCDDNISGLSDGEVIDVCFTHTNEEVKLRAHFTRADRLPKPGYLHGSEPTREDLDVCRALGNMSVSPENHPNVFHWKINLSRFCGDKKYRWQSPAKVKTILGQSTPHASPKRTKSPLVPYGSPIGYGYEEKKSLVSSDIRTTLFPSIYE